jgi:hypothetical protein
VTDVHRPLELLSVVQGEKALHLRARIMRRPMRPQPPPERPATEEGR